MSLNSLKERFQELSLKIQKLDYKDDNVMKRKLYAESELLRMDIDQNPAFAQGVEGLRIKNELGKYNESFNITATRRAKRIYDILDEIVRLSAACFTLMTTAVFFSIPIIFINPLDYSLIRFNVISSEQKIAKKLKQMICQYILLVSGIEMVVDIKDKETFKKSKTLTFYSHGSTLDPFMIGATCPARHVSIAKSDLFLVPYFAWLIVAFGTIAIDRSNRDSAVMALNKATKMIGDDDCVCIAPEGTRTKTGNIQEFKKGPFYLWEELNCPIIPIVVYGAFDMHPPQKYMTMPGRVHIKYLEAISPDKAKTREEMSNLVRRAMLEDSLNTPDDICTSLSTFSRLKSIMGIVFLFGSHYLLWIWYLRDLLFITFHLSITHIISVFVSASVVITLTLYIYAVYAVHWFTTRKK